MFKSKPLLLAVLILSFLSCKKDSKPITPSFEPVNMKLVSVEKKGKFRAYENAAPINDQARLDYFESRLIKYFFYNDGKSETSLSFTTQDTAVWTAGVSTKYSFEMKDDTFILHSKDYIPMSAYDMENALFEKMWKYFRKTNSSVINGVTQKYREDLVVGYGNFTTIKVAMYAYAFSSGPEGSAIHLNGGFSNEFNPASVALLGPNDELAIQEYEFTFVKK